MGLTKEDFADKAGVALTVIRKIEQGKENLRLLKVNQVLSLFGHILVPTNEKDATRNIPIINKNSSHTFLVNADITNK